ncbi:MAG: biosynthetic-type acetolactate synthase large subunit [Leptospirales bacterium]
MEKEARKKTSAKVMIDLLKKNGVDVCWGYPGGAILPFYDEMYHSDIHHVLVRHEQAAAFAANGFARATGKLGVAISTSGPGATNLFTGIADAKIDSIPVLFITGQVGTKDIGTDAFQESDTYGMSISVTKYNALIKDPDDVARITQEAISVALARRQGATLIDFPKDVQAAVTEVEEPGEFQIEEYHYKNPPVTGDLDRLIDALNRSTRPLLYVGGGVISAEVSSELREIVEKANIPVTSTLMGLGAFPGQHDLFVGMLGMHGTGYANKAVMECDLIVSLGARFDDRVAGDAKEFASQAIRAQVEIDPAEIEKRVHVDLHVQGNLAEIMPLLNKGIKKAGREEWVKRIQTLKEENPLVFNRVEGKIKPQYFIHRLSERTNGNAVVATDVGQHQMWAAQFYAVNKPRNWLTSGGLGAMGFGLPAALGAKMGRPDDDVYLITGDGSIQMNIQELATLKMYNIPVKIILFHNGFLGMVRQWQELFYGARYSSSVLTDVNPDFMKVAEGYGIASKKISKADEIEAGLDFLIDSKEACLLEVMIPASEKVYPMIPSGHKYEDMIAFDPKSEEGEPFSVIPHKSGGGK